MKQILTILLIVTSVNLFGQKKDSTATQTFVLVGPLQSFELLFKAVMTPDDVTNNQRKVLSDWIQKVQAIPKEADKPKEQKPKN